MTNVHQSVSVWIAERGCEVSWPATRVAAVSAERGRRQLRVEVQEWAVGVHGTLIAKAALARLETYRDREICEVGGRCDHAYCRTYAGAFTEREARPEVGPRGGLQVWFYL